MKYQQLSYDNIDNQYLIRQIGARLHDFLNKFKNNPTFEIENSGLPQLLTSLCNQHPKEFERVFNQYDFDFLLTPNSLIIAHNDMDFKIHRIDFDLIRNDFDYGIKCFFKQKNI